MEGFLDGVVERICPGAKIVNASQGLLPEMKKHSCGNPQHCKHHHYHHNEHILAAPGTAARAVSSIGNQLRGFVPRTAAAQIGKNTVYWHNAFEKIASDYRAFSQTVPFEKKRVLVQHSLFDYLAKEAGFEVKGSIFEHDLQEPSAADAAGLIRKIRKDKIFAIFAEPGKKSRMTEMIAKESRIPVIYLQANPETDHPEEMLQMFRNDLEILKKAVAEK